jgi:hypothetical protein
MDDAYAGEIRENVTKNYSPRWTASFKVEALTCALLGSYFLFEALISSTGDRNVSGSQTARRSGQKEMPHSYQLEKSAA